METEKQVVKRAIILAAGLGKRIQPVSFETPKPLITVNGNRMIDTVIDALKQNGITEIYIVIGHLKEKFNAYAGITGITLIENPYYLTSNNISSLYVARDYLEECMILDGDQIVRNSVALAPAFYRSGYNAVWTDHETNEWLMNVENGIVKSCSRNGGSHGWQLYSVSRWSAKDGKMLRQCVEQEYESGHTDIYWDDVPLFLHSDKFRLGIHEMGPEDIVEIDGIEELAAEDAEYRKYLD